MIARSSGVRNRPGPGLAPGRGFPENAGVNGDDAPALPLTALADRCVQCGLCLPTCPTYRMEGLEAESPRGRIALIRGLETGALAPTPAIDAHLDACLGCRRCEAVCPAGVEYGTLLTGARARQRLRRPPGPRQRLAETLAARPRMLSAVLAAYRMTWSLLPRAARPLPRPPARAVDPPPAAMPRDTRAA